MRHPLRFLWPLFLVTVSSQDIVTTCANGLDVYLCVDHSSSITASGWVQVTNFVRGFMNAYKDVPGFRMSIYSFGSCAFPILPLTNDPDIVEHALQVLQNNTIDSGFTQMAKAMEFAIIDMTNQDINRGKLLFLMTDGQMTELSVPVNESQVVVWADYARTLGATIMSLGIGSAEDLDVDLLIAAANKQVGTQNFFFRVPTFSEIGQVLDELDFGKKCININAVYPGGQCAPFQGTVIVEGTGFDTGLNFQPDNSYCSFEWWEDGNKTRYVRKGEYTKSDKGIERLTCESPELNNLTNVEIKVDKDKDFTLSGQILVIWPEDDPHCVPVAAAFPWYIPFLLFPLLLLLLWFFWPRMPGGKKFFDPDEEFTAPHLDENTVAPLVPPMKPMAPPTLPPPVEKKRIRKWAKVDTSHYIWARQGGVARPMEVGWGATGAPESAPVKEGEVEYSKPKVKPVVVEEEPPLLPDEPDEPPEPMTFEEEPEFEDLEWDRCCCGICSSSACFCCKNCFSRSWMCLMYVAGLFGKCCRRLCYPCWTCYHFFDRLRPRWNCCCIEDPSKNTNDLAVPLLDRVSDAPPPGRIN